MVLNAASNWLAFVAYLLAALFLAPYVIHKLGDGRNGIWRFAESVLAYFTLFDLGIAACLVRFVARFRAARQTEELNKVCSAGWLLFGLAGGVAFLLGLLVSPALVAVLADETAPAGEVIGFLLLMLVNLAFTLPLSLFPAVLDGLERFSVKSAVKIVFLALRVVATVVVLERSPGLVELAAVITACNLLEHGCMAALVWRFLPELRLSPRRVDRPTLRLVRSYSLDAFLAMIAGRISFQTDAIVIGLFLLKPQITYFDLAARLVEYSKSLLRSATTTLTPTVSSLEATDQLSAIRGVLTHATRGLLYLVLPVQVGLVIFGWPFLELWMGSPDYPAASYGVLVVLSSSLALTVAQSVCGRILFGTGRIRLFARMALLESVGNLLLSVILVRPFGILGVAVGTAVPNVLFNLFVLIHTCRLLDVSAGAYFRQCWARPLAAAAVLASLWSAVTGLAPVTTWGDLLAAGAGGLAAYALMVAGLEGWRGRWARPLATRWRALRALVTPRLFGPRHEPN